jgi:hypothetical protein
MALKVTPIDFPRFFLDRNDIFARLLSADSACSRNAYNARKNIVIFNSKKKVKKSEILRENDWCDI